MSFFYDIFYEASYMFFGLAVAAYGLKEASHGLERLKGHFRPQKEFVFVPYKEKGSPHQEDCDQETEASEIELPTDKQQQ